jgi:phytoene dehydrogenase-like protein
MNVIVIGSGLSGLTSAALMAQKNHSVFLFEQNETIGGITATIEKDGYKWDWGQMLIPDLSQGEPGRKILEQLEVSDMVQVVKSYRENYFPDFRISKPETYKGIYWRKDYFKELFPENAEGLEKYYKIYDRIHDIMALSNKSDYLSKIKLFMKFLPLMRKKNWSAHDLMEYCFPDNEKLHMVFTGILADYVSSPKTFPGLIIPTINAESQYDERVPLDYGKHEHRSSWTYIINGTGSLVEALAAAAKKYGAEIKTNRAISKINIKNGRVIGAKTENGEEFDIDIIIASGGAKELFLKLVGKEHLSEDYINTYLKSLEITESVFMVHLGVDYDPSVHQNGAALCYYYLGYDVENAIKECKEGIYHEGEEGFLAYIPSIHSPQMAPSGHHSITIYTIAPNNPVNGTWENNKNDWAEKLLDIAEEFIPGLREHEQTRIVLTPEDFRERTYLDYHAFGGTVPHLEVPPPPHKTPIEGLWFVGAQSENFGGVTGAMTGALETVNQICKDQEN